MTRKAARSAGTHTPIKSVQSRPFRPAGGSVATRRDMLKYSGALTAAGALAVSGNHLKAAMMSPSVQSFPAVHGAVAVTAVKRLANGAELTLATGCLRLLVYTDRVIRVLYSPLGANQPPHESLAVIAAPAAVAWKLHEPDGYVEVATAHLAVRVNRRTGAVDFVDAEGKPFLAENPAGGKFMEPFTFKDVPTCRVRQEFVIRPDEALYGLGQHQQGVMNYNGKSVRLMQENRHVAVPVLLSSRGYGIFWDNPAVTDVSAGAALLGSIPVANLFDASGAAGGLTGNYYSGIDFQTPKATRVDSSFDFNSQTNWAHGPLNGIGATNFSIRWQGEILAPTTGDYTFATTSDDGARLWINGRQLINDWHTQPATQSAGHIHLEAGKKYSIKIEYFQQTGPSAFQLHWQPPTENSADQKLIWQSAVGNWIDYYVIRGPELDDVIAAWRDISGPAPMMGKWVWGFWQCKEHYNTQLQVLGVAAEYRSMHIPMDGIIQDWYYWVPYPWGSNKFDPVRYPNPGDMIAALHKENLHFMISVWGKFATGSANYEEMEKAGVLYPPTGGSTANWNPVTRYYDPFNPLGRKLYWHNLKTQLFSLGVDGWWLDASEPELGGNWGEFANIKTYLGWGAFVYNAYPLMHTQAVYDGQRATTSQKRVMILTRSAWAGQQRHSAITWSGDIQGTWQVLRRQIAGGINFALSGIPYWNTDIGGFFIHQTPQDPAYQELFVRWYQFGAFCPLFRVHGTDYPKEMWRFGPKIMPMLVKFDHLRYRLLPYIYSVSWMVTHKGYTMLRGLILDFRTDPAVHGIGDQFMFGPAVLVNPVLEPGAKTRNVYLPTGCKWIDFWTGTQHSGGTHIQAGAELDSMPLFVRGGSIVPMGPVVQYAAEPADPLEIRLYAGADGSFTLYEDENDTYNYERGVYATIDFKWIDHARALQIGERKGRFPGMLKQRTFHIVLVKPGHGEGLEPAASPDKVVTYTGTAVEIML